MKSLHGAKNSWVLLLLAAAVTPATESFSAPRPLSFNTACSSIAAAGTPLAPGVNCRFVAVDGYPRKYIVYVPTSPSFHLEKESPVVFFFHGSGGGAENAFESTGWREKADATGFIAVFGSGLHYRELYTGEIKTHWNSLNLTATVDVTARPPGYPAGAPWPANDVAFTDAMLADVQAGLRVDARRIYIAGFSNGGGMTLRLAIERSETFAAAATAGAGRLGGIFDAPRKMPLYYAIGDRDGHLVDSINFAPDAPVPPLRRVPLTYAEAFGFSAVQDRFDDLTSTFGVPSDPDHVWEFSNELRVRYRTVGNPNDPDANEVTVSIQGGVTHEYPNGNDNPAGFDDTELFWKFFHDNPIPN